ncbi:MAG TPA: adenylate/guanylate cyclase domain-containing protein [Chthoniobacterales bacterium]|nr:adenylate/guanylate cyclase domain-containing protein [Chthoniobacterales bacterium]
MERRLTAILAADVVGYSRLMGTDEGGTLAAFNAIRAEIDGKIAEHQGRIFKLTGDGMLAEFPSVVRAVACAAEIQRGMRERNADVPQDRRLVFRIGVHLGDVIAQDDDVFGDGVNVAVRLEGIAGAGGIAVSESVREHVGNRLELIFEDRGEQQLKNMEQPIRVYDVALEEAIQPVPGLTKSDKPSIAVLPFTNMSGDPEQEYFSDGITEDIITDLSKISALHVIARHTSLAYKGRPVKVQAVGRELGVGFMLEGSVRKADRRIRVTGQLIECANGTHIWAERFDRDLTDIFAIQDEITHAIVEQLKVKLLPQEKQSIGQKRTDNVEAYTYYLRGRDFFYRHSRRYFELARRMFAKAAELDPNYARAYAGMADCDSLLISNYQADADIDEILALTARALELDDHLAEAHASRAFALSIAHRTEEAEIEFERALALDANSFEAHFLYARASFIQGNLERAARLFERASEIRRDDYQSPCLLIHIYRSLGRKDKSLEAARQGIALAEGELALHPEDPRPAHLGIAALIEIGEHDRAREWIARALAIDPDDPLTLYNVACGYTKLGDLDAAFQALERALPRFGAAFRNWVKYDSDLDGLRADPRYQKILDWINET